MINKWQEDKPSKSPANLLGQNIRDLKTGIRERLGVEHYTYAENDDLQANTGQHKAGECSVAFIGTKEEIMALPLKKGAIAVEKDIYTVFICDGIDWIVTNNIQYKHKTNSIYADKITLTLSPVQTTLWSIEIDKSKLIHLEGKNIVKLEGMAVAQPDTFFDIIYKSGLYLNNTKIEKTQQSYRAHITYHEYLQSYYEEKIYTMEYNFLSMLQPALLEYRIEYYYLYNTPANAKIQFGNYDFHIGII